MEILSAGAFINLENQEKIEQLKFTAAELANAAVETEGFVNTEESGKNLALEFWQGLEYMSRETEEATIKNIFLNHFLDRLREFRPTQSANIDSPQKTEQVVTEQINYKEKPEDEFLGVIEMTAEEENSIEEIEVVVEEDLTQPEEFSTLGNDSVQETEVKTTENISTDSVEETASATSEIEDKVEPSPENAVEVKTAVNNLALLEKEPYQFNKCTVTATIQLLPIGDDGSISRKAVFSVRTHDFAPQISLIQLAGDNLIAEIMPELEKVLAKYQSDLPAKVMDKLKKEKTATKKGAPKTTSEVKAVSQVAAKPKESVKTQTQPLESNQTAAPVASPPVQTGQQGNLFGF